MESQDLTIVPAKQKGLCPFCSQAVEAIIVEENTARRDKCRCPQCGETVFVCRTPSCHDYAKGTASWDHELCPACSAQAGKAVVEVGKVAAKVAGTVVTAVLVAAVTKEKK